MSIQIAVLRSGDQVITKVTDMKSDDGNLIGYTFFKPCIIVLNEREVPILSGEKVKTYDLKMHPWIPLTEQENISIPLDHVTTFVEPVAKADKIYRENVLGENGAWEKGRPDGGLEPEDIEELEKEKKEVEELKSSD